MDKRTKMTPIQLLLLGLLLLSGRLVVGNSTNSMLFAYKNDLDILKNSPRILQSSPDDVSDKVFFYLYTRKNETKQRLIPKRFKYFLPGNFEPSLPTKFVIHGFLSNSEDRMPQTIKDNLLDNANVNVILVDWGAIAKGINYTWIVSKTREVGVFTARLIDLLVGLGAKVRDIHLIGHSLGAHVCGFAGNAVRKGQIGRITGLDPAKPGFHKVSPEERLNPSNAEFVDCIHTCSGILGLAEPICTADFYPNGGVNTQPGCDFFDFGRCSHLRSMGYFAESIYPSHKFPAELCTSIPNTSHPNCFPSHVQMGYYASYGASGIFYVTTMSKPPYSPFIL